ncbi:MAG: inorganic polyphosphate/ATP-NAD kinase [Chloroflexi bacterium OLB15]|nr:MAG: inorganic polyphosphate/ATP-NAD kinase [Chloroflexi bacterium OLB15]
MTLQRFGILAHPLRPQTVPVGAEMAASLRQHGFDTWFLETWTEEQLAASLDGTQMVIAIGGDGAMLRAARVCGPASVPVLGVNMGKLGFLTEIAPDEWEQTLPLLREDRYWIEDRMMITASVLRDGVELLRLDALNDVVVSRGGEMGLVRVSAYIDSGWTTTYNCDAVIVATATGSTAYALASGGPILPPELRNLLVVPVAPHLSLDRSIVLPRGADVDLRIEEMRIHPFLAIDGVNVFQFQANDILRVQASQHTARFVRLREKTYFYRSLLDRLEPRVSNEPR